MAQTVRIGFDKEGDSLEVLFWDEPDHLLKTRNDAMVENPLDWLMEKPDAPNA